MKTFHFVKHIGIDIKANSLDEARKYLKIAERHTDSKIDGFVYSMYKGERCGIDIDAHVEDAHSGYAEYAGYTEDVKDSEKRLYDYLADNDTPPKKTDYVGKIVIALRG